ncbi:hypothetical protein HQ47_05350 [Porphyromonas macacae]|uniref:Uncharacterized protein n=1 Tax=Porphyromonas macacae TaxID=28115 RepID=A0A0A2EAG9_9PORP|nr:hypothetical protein HQ47_05350 [Porphyromonas macacae]
MGVVATLCPEYIIWVRVSDKDAIDDMMMDKQRYTCIIGKESHHHKIVKDAPHAMSVFMPFHHFCIFRKYKPNIIFFLKFLAETDKIPYYTEAGTFLGE